MGQLPVKRGVGVGRLTRELVRGRESQVVIVAKVQAQLLAAGFFPFDDSGYSLVMEYVRSTFVSVDETRFFTLYR